MLAIAVAESVSVDGMDGVLQGLWKDSCPGEVVVVVPGSFKIVNTLV